MASLLSCIVSFLGVALSYYLISNVLRFPWDFEIAVLDISVTAN